MRDRLLLLFYLAWVVLLTTIHDVSFLATALVVTLVATLALTGRRTFRLLRRALAAVLWFNLALSVSYLVVASAQGRSPWSYLVLVNVRVLALTVSALLAGQYVNLVRAFAFSRTLSPVIAIAYGQIATMRRVLGEFSDALRSRTPGRPGLRLLYRHRGAAGAALVGKSLHEAGEIGLAMRSRGLLP